LKSVWWIWLFDALIARAEWAAAGAVVACAASGCGADKQAAKPHPSPSEVRPPIARPAGQRIATNGDTYYQCYVIGTVNGGSAGPASFTFLIDTGASDVSFGKNDAKKLGFDPAKLSFDQTYSSANGIGHQAAVTLPELRLGGVVVARNVEASIVNADMSRPLLGASILKTLHLQYSQGNCELTLPGRGTVATKRERIATKY
jgi:clan AA aspartic protease (TIGR02281 family)